MTGDIPIYGCIFLARRWQAVAIGGILMTLLNPLTPGQGMTEGRGADHSSPCPIRLLGHLSAVEASIASWQRATEMRRVQPR